MSKIAYECKKCGQKYRIKEGIEDISCQACEGDLKQIKMYSVSEYESLPEVPAEIKQATEGDFLKALDIEGEVLPDAEDGINTEEKTDDSGGAETDPPLLDEEGNPLSPEAEDLENGEITDDADFEPGEAEADVMDIENDIIVNDESMIPEEVEVSSEPAEEMQPETAEGGE